MNMIYRDKSYLIYSYLDYIIITLNRKYTRDINYLNNIKTIVDNKKIYEINFTLGTIYNNITIVSIKDLYNNLHNNVLLSKYYKYIIKENNLLYPLSVFQYDIFKEEPIYLDTFSILKLNSIEDCYIEKYKYTIQKYDIFKGPYNYTYLGAIN